MIEFDNRDKSNSLKKTRRLTNMEILRILAMFLVIGVHANFYSLGTPTSVTIAANPLASIIRIVLCVICCMSVNLFILISGYFSIKPCFKGFCKFVFQCLYFTIGIYAIMLIVGKSSFSWNSILQCFFLTKWDWFVKAYIGLYIIAPILNTFVANSSKKQLQYFLISFYLFQTIYAFRGAAIFIESGYSTFSFIGLYMIGRYSSKYINDNSISNINLVLLVVLPILLISSIYYFDASKDTFMFSGMCLSYANPIMIIAAWATVLLFTRLNVAYNRVINFVSASVFAVYLFHYDIHILQPYFCKTSQIIYANFSGLCCIAIEILFLVVVFVLSVVLDQPRKLLWKVIEKCCFRIDNSRKNIDTVKVRM